MQALETLVEAYRRINDMKMATNTLQRVVALRPFDIGVYLRPRLPCCRSVAPGRTPCLSWGGNHSRRYPRDPAVWLAVGRLALDQGDTEGAQRAFDQLAPLPDVELARALLAALIAFSTRESLPRRLTGWSGCWQRFPLLNRPFCPS